MSSADPTFDALGGWRGVLGELTASRDITAEQARVAMAEILSGEASPAQIAAFIVALHMKGETVDEVGGMVDAMLAAAAPIELPGGADPVDIVGTGGAPSRRAHALNVSTMACFVVAGAGGSVLKHGNRKASSTSGSFDLLEALGVNAEVDGAEVTRCFVEAGIAFCFARAFHPAMRFAGPVRADLGVPTVFNFLGPLSHPARVRRMVIGVSDPVLAPVVIGTLQLRHVTRAMVVYGHDGTDELVTTGPSTVFELADGDVRRSEIRPADFGLAEVSVEAVAGGDAETNAEIAGRVFSGEKGPYRDIVALNAAAGLWAGGGVDSIADGLERAFASIDTGGAADALERLRVVSNVLPG